MKRGLFQLQYELDADMVYTEQGTDRGAKLSESHVDNDEVRSILDTTSQLSTKEWIKWLSIHRDDYSFMSVVPLSTITPQALRYRLEGQRPSLMFVTRPLHTIQ